MASSVFTISGWRISRTMIFRDQRHRSFRSSQETSEIVARQIRFFAAGIDDVSVGQNKLQTQHVIGRDTVGERVRPAGVLGDVAADRARALAGRIGRIEIPCACTASVTSRLTTPGCTTARSFSISISRIRFMRAKRDHHAAGARNGASAQTGARAASDDRHAVFGR